MPPGSKVTYAWVGCDFVGLFPTRRVDAPVASPKADVRKGYGNRPFNVFMLWLIRIRRDRRILQFGVLLQLDFVAQFNFQAA